MSDTPRYCRKCKAWHSPADAGWKAGCASEWPPATGSSARKPAAVFHVGSFILDELQERGWSIGELSRRMGGDSTTQLTVELLIHVPMKGVMLDEHTASLLSKGFGTSKELWLKLDEAWQHNAPDEPPAGKDQNDRRK